MTRQEVYKEYTLRLYVPRMPVGANQVTLTSDIGRKCTHLPLSHGKGMGGSGGRGRPVGRPIN